ncbi:MAG: nickel import ATP-binding protein NikE [Brachymonas sp.]|nr:nickel import ATP-binding protein NikE [Brachymonas sp.]
MRPANHHPLPVLACKDLHKSYAPGWFSAGSAKHVLQGIKLHIHEGESVALLGESGSGKSTLGRQLLGFEKPSAGEVLYRGQPLQTLSAEGNKDFRRHVQMVFQDSVAAVNPRYRIGRAIEEPLRYLTAMSEAARKARVAELLELVALQAQDADKLPLQMSGGQLQRVCIARALASSPKLIVLDEAVSSLDLTLQIQILDLLTELRNKLGVAYLFITHDLRLVRRFCDRLIVLANGQVVEEAAVPAHGPVRLAHPLSRKLQEAILPARPAAAQPRAPANTAAPTA